MLQMLLVRFVVGGAIVSLFALLGDLLHPKGFAGLFAAAPSVAIATLALTLAAEGPAYAALEARSMIVAEVAFIAYAAACVYFLGIRHTKAAPTAVLLLGLWGLSLRRSTSGSSSRDHQTEASSTQADSVA